MTYWSTAWPGSYCDLMYLQMFLQNAIFFYLSVIIIHASLQGE